MYNTETWTLKEEIKRRLSVFEMTCLRRIEGVTRKDRIRNEQIKERVKCTQDVVSKIQQRRLRYIGHICVVNDERYPQDRRRAWAKKQRKTKEKMDRCHPE